MFAVFEAAWDISVQFLLNNITRIAIVDKGQVQNAYFPLYLIESRHYNDFMIVKSKEFQKSCLVASSWAGDHK